MERYLKALQELMGQTGATGSSREPVRRFRSGSYTSDDAYETPDSFAGTVSPDDPGRDYRGGSGPDYDILVTGGNVGSNTPNYNFTTPGGGSAGEGADGTETPQPTASKPSAPSAPSTPSGFNAAAYLAANPDVAANWGGSAAEHWEQYGQYENRNLAPVTSKPSAPSTPKPKPKWTEKNLDSQISTAKKDLADSTDVYTTSNGSVRMSDGTVTSAKGYRTVRESAIASAVDAYKTNAQVLRSTTLDPTKQANIDNLVSKLEGMSVAQINNFTTNMGGTASTKAASYSFTAPDEIAREGREEQGTAGDTTQGDSVVFGSASFDEEDQETFDEAVKGEPEEPTVAATLTPKGVGLGMPITELTDGVDYSFDDKGRMTLYQSGAEKVQAYNDALDGKENKYGITQNEALSIQQQGDVLGLPTVQVNLKSSTFSFAPGKSAAGDEGAKGSTDQPEGTPDDTSAGSTTGGSGRIGESTKKIPGLDVGDKSIYDNKVTEPMRQPEDPDWFAWEYSEDPNAIIPSTPEEQDPSGIGLTPDPGGIGILPGAPTLIGPSGDDLIGFEYDYPDYPTQDDTTDEKGSPITPPSTETGKGPGVGVEGTGPSGGGDGGSDGPGGPGVGSTQDQYDSDSGGDSGKVATVDEVLPYDFGDPLTYDPGLNLQYRTPQVDRAYDFMRDFGRYTLSEDIADEYAKNAETSKMSLPYTPEYMEPISLMDEARQAELLPLIGQRFEPGLGEFGYDLTKDPLESAQEIIDALEAEEEYKAFDIRNYEDLLPPDYNPFDNWLDFYRRQQGILVDAPLSSEPETSD